MMRKFCTLLLLSAACVCGEARAQEPVARIAGLENNEEYMSLLREDARLQIREDSIVNAAEQVRRQLREHPEERQRYAQEIMALEERIFELRNAKGKLVDRINTIEQDWALANMTSAPAAPETGLPAGIADAVPSRDLTGNGLFRRHLAPEEYARLLEAQRGEMRAVELVNRCFAQYGAMAELAEGYAAAATEEEAVPIYGNYLAQRDSLDMTSDSLSAIWSAVFDDKMYAYSYLLEKLGQEELLAFGDERRADAVRQAAALKGEYASDALADYFLRKRVVVSCEIDLAGVLRLDAVRDSLEHVSAQVEAVDFRLPKIEPAERNFLDYAPVEFSSTPKYDYKNPIPECKVSPRGTIYRLLVGTFSSKRPVSTFRGASPVAYLLTEKKEWQYFIGGFATRAEAEEARQQLLDHGFRRPEITVWTDGIYRNLARESEAPALYRVEIGGTDSLPDEVKRAIDAVAEGVEISRVGGSLFVTGTFDDRAVADRVAAAAREAASSLEIKVTEIVGD